MQKLKLFSFEKTFLRFQFLSLLNYTDFKELFSWDKDQGGGRLTTRRTSQTVALVEAIWTVILAVTELSGGDTKVDGGPGTQHLGAVANRRGALVDERWHGARLWWDRRRCSTKS